MVSLTPADHAPARPGEAASRASKRPGEDGGRALKRNVPLVPADMVAGRALVTVIAIMTFLAALAAGMVLTIADASRTWQSDVSGEMTIQVRPVANGNLDAATNDAAAIARATPGIKSVDPYSKSESEKLLQPWLGADLDLGSLPVPRLIVVKLDPDRRLDAARLRDTLDAKVPGVSLDDHGMWLSRLRTMARATVVVGLAIFLLVLTAMLLAVGFATRGAMAGAREVIEVLHYVGAADSFISQQFQAHFLRLGLRGGAIGGGLAILFFLVCGQAAGAWRTTAGGEQVEALFGTFSLHPAGYFAIAALAGLVAVLTGAVSRLIVFRHLRRLM